MKPSLWTLFVARRYFASSRRSRGLASSLLSVLQMALGTATLIVVIGVMNGFQSGFIRSIMEIGSYHVRIESPPSSREALSEAIASDPLVSSVTPFADLQVIAKGRFGSVQAINLRLVDDDALKRDRGLREALGLDPGQSALAGENSILIGAELARSLELRSGDELEVLTARMDEDSGVVPERSTLHVASVFRTANKAYYEYDRTWAFASLGTGRGLGLSETDIRLGVKLRDSSKDGKFISLARKLPLAADAGISSWRDYNRAFFGALKMEKTVMMLMIGLVFLIVAVNTFHSMRRSVHERHEELGLIRAIGGSPAEMRAIFLVEGFIIGLVGSFSGLCIGLGLAYNVNGIFAAAAGAVNVAIELARLVASPFSPSGQSFSLFSPAYFYIDSIPVAVYFPEALTAFASGLAAALGSAYFASRRLSESRPQEIIRYE
jgi:lipoprotein-releasing system permease protein